MQAKRKLTALLLSLCMLLGMLPMTAFAAGVPAAPTNLKLEVTADGLKVSWDKPETTGGLDIFEYEVTLYGHFDGIAGGKTKVETKTVQRETTCTFTNTGNAEGVINPNYEVEVKAREGVSGTGDPDNLGNYQVTDWTDWSNASTVSLDWNEVTFNTTINNYYTGVVDVGLPDSENKLYKEGITATGNPDVTQPDGTTSDSEERAVTELLYQYFEENKQTVPDLENVTVDDLTVEAVLDRFESSQEGDGNSWTPTINATVNRYYTLRLVYNPEADSNNPDEKQIVNAVNLVNVSISMEMGLTPAFTAEVDSSDQDKYEVYLEQWSGSDGKSITSEESFNSKIPEDERITTFEEGVTYRYSVWVKAKEGYAISEEASVYLNGRPANKGYTLTNHDEPKRPDGSFLSGTFNSLFVMECVFDPLKVNGRLCRHTCAYSEPYHCAERRKPDQRQRQHRKRDLFQREPDHYGRWHPEDGGHRFRPLRQHYHYDYRRRRREYSRYIFQRQRASAVFGGTCPPRADGGRSRLNRMEQRREWHGLWRSRYQRLSYGEERRGCENRFHEL